MVGSGISDVIYPPTIKAVNSRSETLGDIYNFITILL
jgi:hypothetical protein